MIQKAILVCPPGGGDRVSPGGGDGVPAHGGGRGRQHAGGSDHPREGGAGAPREGGRMGAAARALDGGGGHRKVVNIISQNMVCS